ncbi:hypothetical protein [Actinomadura madurae]|uniref:Fibronectin type-III domain-containing protein n=1 Tax=Actinomadura madurae TaxID=1993 RepID=A0A1I5YA45_9ACTN|nr:hypothetical protein [Actinomadura madurae]SFQ41043.1 hypothetical protein SAMN04489713_1312 [Actinomadura madurae]SPT52147.1 Uncharacterised protein [Actinomadura madurae]
MTTAPDLVVAGDRGLSGKLRGTGRFRTVIDVASATELWELHESGHVGPPAAFVFGPEFDENLPGAGVPHLAGDLAARGSTVLVHGFFTERGDLFGPEVIANTGPLSLSDLMTMLGAPEPAGGAEPDLLPEPPPEPWALPTAVPSEPVARPDRPGDAPERPRPGDLPEPPHPGEAAEPPPDRSVAPTDKLVASWRTSRAATAPEAAPDAAPAPVPAPGPVHVPGDGDAPVEPVEPSPSNDWENLTGWSWEETAPEPGDTFDPREAAAALAAPAAPVHRRGRRKPVLAAALAVLVLAGTAVGVTTLTAGSETTGRPTRAASSPPAPSPARTPGTPAPGTRTSQAKPSRPPASAPTSLKPVQEYVPGQVRIVDGRISIEVTWTDRSGGRAAHYVVGGPSGRPPSTLASAAPGTAKVTVTALNPSVDYCLTVVAVMDVDRVSQAKPVCTHRVPRRG